MTPMLDENDLARWEWEGGTLAPSPAKVRPIPSWLIPTPPPPPPPFNLFRAAPLFIARLIVFPIIILPALLLLAVGLVVERFMDGEDWVGWRGWRDE